VEDVTTIEQDIYLENPDILFVLFDLSNKKTFDDVSNKLLPLIEAANYTKSIIVVGTKLNIKEQVTAKKEKNSLALLFKDDKAKVIKKWKGERKNFVSSCEMDVNKAAQIKSIACFFTEVVKTTKLQVKKIFDCQKANVAFLPSTGAVHVWGKGPAKVCTPPAWHPLPADKDAAKDKDPVVHVSISLYTRILTLKSGKIKTQGLRNLANDGPPSTCDLEIAPKAPSAACYFSDPFDPCKDKIIKTWQIYLNEENKVAFALIKSAEESKIYSFGKSKLGMLG